MFHARAAALRSASLQRQVGAVVATTDGDIIAVGANEVPKAGGGLYWAGDATDNRDFVLGYETSDRLKRRMLADVLQRLQKEWLAPEKKAQDIETLVDEVSEGPMKNSQLMNIIEFGRCVHAEMAALVDAARRGVSVKNCTLFTTTFPCHDCARHIVAAGVKRVVYIEPYPKSLVPELYLDSISLEGTKTCEGQLSFEPFVGISPRRYMDLFAMVERKDKMGKISGWNSSLVFPRLGDYYPSSAFVTLALEERCFGVFTRQLKEVGEKWKVAKETKETKD